MTTSRYLGIFLLTVSLATARGGDDKATGAGSPEPSQAELEKLVPELPGQIVQALPEQIVQPLPGQIVGWLPEQVVQALPGQIVQPLPGQMVRALPEQIVPALPGQMVRWPRRHVKPLAKTGTLTQAAAKAPAQ